MRRHSFRKAIVNVWRGINNCQQHGGESVIKMLLRGLICLSLVGMANISICVNANAYESENAKRIYAIDIDRQSLASALTQLSEQVDVQVFFPYNLTQGKTANAIKGKFTALQALELMLQGSGLYGGLSRRGVLIISTSKSVLIYKKIKGMDAMNTKKKLLASSMALFMGSGGVGYLGAAEMDKGSDGASFQEIDEIVVTASRREESLQNVGMSVTAVDPEEFTSVGLVKLSDVIAYTPGVSFLNNTGTPDGTKISIRGVGNSDVGGLSSSSATVGVYMDSTSTTSNSPWALAGNFSFDGLLGDVERIEFLRGPQGTLYGSSSLGGAIKYITRKPSLKGFRGHISADASSTKEGGISQLYNGRFSMPIIENRLGLTIAGFLDDSRGFVDRVDTGGILLQEDADRSERYGISGDLYYQHSDRVDFRARVLEQKLDYTGTSSLALDPLTGSPQHGGFESADGPTTSYNKSTFYTAALSVQFNGATLTATSSYVDRQRFVQSDVTNPLVVAAFDPGGALFPFAVAAGRTFTGSTTALSTIDDIGSKKFTQEVQLSSESSDTVEWIAGLYYADEDTFNSSDQELQPDGFVVRGLTVPSFYKEIAAFGNLTYYIIPEFDLTVGARLSRNEMTLKEERVSIFPTVPPFTTPIEDTVDTWSFTARYRPNEDFSLYTRIASGYRPAFANSNRSEPPFVAPQKVESDSMWSYEVGAKGSLAEGLLSYDLALWALKWDNYQTFINFSPTFSPRANVSGGVSGKGFEASFAIHPFDGFSILTNLAYTEMTLNEDDPLLNGLKGQQLPRVPEWTFSSRGSYAFALSDELDASLGLGVRYEDSSRSSFTDAEVFVPGAIPPPGGFDTFFNLPSDSYVVVDANTALTWDKTVLSLYATNLLNERALTATSGSIGSAGAVPLKPRTIGIRLSMDF